MATIKLYDADAYRTTFEATVVSCNSIIDENTKEQRYAVVFDQTVFFPEEGGQSPDQGIISPLSQPQDKIPVADVQIQKDESGEDIIYHYLNAPLEVGTHISGEIDWNHRFSNMQQHSAEHIFSGLMHRKYGFSNVGFHLSDQIVTMDFDGMITPEEIWQAEYEVNEAIAKNVPVTTGYPTHEELEQLEYRSKGGIEGEIRIVTIEGYDVCACCAPHVARTGEIGLFKILNVASHRGGMRISFLCGFRALEAFRKKEAIVNELVNLFSTNEENIATNVNKLRAELSMTKGLLANTTRQLLAMQIESIDPAQRDVFLFVDGLEGKALRDTVNTLVEKHEGLCGIFVGTADGYQYILASKTIDCKQIADSMREHLGAKGGGSNRMIQGTVAAEEQALRDFFAQALA